MSKTIASFDKAVPTYDAAAVLQQNVAETLMQGVQVSDPATILDIGCGTGLVSAIAAARWPEAQLTVLDAAPSMLNATCQKVPQAMPILMDAASLSLPQRFDLILSSMMLHWTDRPAHTMRLWRALLNPGGTMHVALPVAGSLWEWKSLCASQGVADGLWPFPVAASFSGAGAEATLRPLTLRFPSAQAFLRNMKATGAQTPNPSHTQQSAATMRRVLKAGSRPFDVTYQILYWRVKNLG